MSNEYIMVDVRKGPAELAMKVIKYAVIISLTSIILSIILWVSDSTEVATILAIVGFSVIALGFLAYGIIVLIGSIESSEGKYIAKMIAIILPSSLGLLFLLVWLLTL